MLENATRQVRHLAAVIRSLTAGSLRDGHEHAADFPAYRIGIIVRADKGHETYVAVRVTGSVPGDLVSVILRNVPACDPELWDPVIRLPERRLLGPEQAWYNLMNPIEAAKLLNEEELAVPVRNRQLRARPRRRDVPICCAAHGLRG